MILSFEVLLVELSLDCLGSQATEYKQNRATYMLKKKKEKGR